jgi:hypothetical protein
LVDPVTWLIDPAFFVDRWAVCPPNFAKVNRSVDLFAIASNG